MSSSITRDPGDTTTADHATLLERYARLIVNVGANVQPGQLVQVGAEIYHRELAYKIAQMCYERGAKFVQLDLSEPRLSRDRILNSDLESLEYVPAATVPRYKEILETNGALIRIIGPEYPEILSDLDPKKLNASRLAQHKAIKFFYDQGISKSQVHWCLAAAPTPNWAFRVFPDYDLARAEEKLWNSIFKVCRVTDENYLSNWDQLNRRLHQRAENLNKLGIKCLHFTGPNTDLRVHLTDKAIFKGGAEKTVTGHWFQPNVPTEEVFTTPDATKTEGTFAATRPFLINGKLIKGLKGRFEAGRLVEFSAEDGEATFREYISSDPNANRLGEVALVGIDSPIFQEGVIFEEILFDENAACHIAVGSAYQFCIKGGPEMSKEELEKIGCNDSTVHTDMMISDETVSVTAIPHNNEQLPLLKAGRWLE